jgi:hypothetical protein
MSQAIKLKIFADRAKAIACPERVIMLRDPTHTPRVAATPTVKQTIEETYDEKLKRTIQVANQTTKKLIAERSATVLLDAPPIAPVIQKKVTKKSHYGFPIKR